MKEYDYSLDAIKGISCIMMIVAHIPLDFNGNERVFQILAGLAPVLFFAVSGVTTTLQARRRSFASMLGFYSLFAVIGFSYNLMWRPELQAFKIMDVPQIIALGVLTVYLLEKYLKPPRYTYLLLSLLAFAVHFFIGRNLPEFPLKSILFTETSGFTYFPWMFAFAAGVFAYRCSNRLNLMIAVASGLLLGLLCYEGIREADFSKYNMSVQYVLLSSVMLFGGFYLFRRIRSYGSAGPLLFIGKHSLLFLFVHLFLILAFERLGLGRLYIVWMWALVLACTYAGMKLLQWLNRYIEAYMKHTAAWILILTGVAAVPLLIGNRDVILLAEAGLGMLFSLNYKKLSDLIPAGQPSRPLPAPPNAAQEQA